MHKAGSSFFQSAPTIVRLPCLYARGLGRFAVQKILYPCRPMTSAWATLFIPTLKIPTIRCGAERSEAGTHHSMWMRSFHGRGPTDRWRYHKTRVITSNQHDFYTGPGRSIGTRGVTSWLSSAPSASSTPAHCSISLRPLAVTQHGRFLPHRESEDPAQSGKGVQYDLLFRTGWSIPKSHTTFPRSLFDL